MFGFSRDDCQSFLPEYLQLHLLAADPFASLDVRGVGSVMRTAVQVPTTVHSTVKPARCCCQGCALFTSASHLIALSSSSHALLSTHPYHYHSVTISVYRAAPQKIRRSNPDCKVGVCGEHGGDPKSIRCVRACVRIV